MSIHTTSAKSMIIDTLKEISSELERDLKSAIRYQISYYEKAKKDTFRRLLGNSESSYDLVQHFKYQSTIFAVLQEMEKAHIELFGKPWDFVEPPIVSPNMVAVPKKRGRPKKS